MVKFLACLLLICKVGWYRQEKGILLQSSSSINSKVANHYCFESPEPAEGCTKFYLQPVSTIKPNSLQSESGLGMFLWFLEK